MSTGAREAETSRGREARRSVVLIAHGSRDAGWPQPLRAVAEKLQALRPDFDVRLSFLEFAAPTPLEAARAAMAAGAAEVVLAPLFLGAGLHVTRDIARVAAELRALYPEAPVRQIPILGELPEILDAIASGLCTVVDREASL